MLARRVVSSKDTHAVKTQIADECLTWSNAAYGPSSRNVAVQPQKSTCSFTLSTVSSRLASLQQIGNPVLRLLLELTVRGQHQHYGDCGLFALQLAARLLKAGLDLGTSPGRRLEVVRAYQQVLEWCVSALGAAFVGETNANQAQHVQHDGILPLQLPLSWSHLPSILALVRTVITPKRLTGLDVNEVEHLCILLVKAFLAGVTVHNSSIAPSIRIVPVVGLPPRNSFTLQGVLMKTVLDPQVSSLLPLHGAVVALFDVPLEPSSLPKHAGDHDDKVDESGALPFRVVSEAAPGEGWSVSAVELDSLLELPEALMDLGVQLVGCQKGIHPALQQALLDRGIVPIARLSLIHIGNMARTCGAIPISSKSPSPMWARCLGQASFVSEKIVQGQQYISIEGQPDSQQAGQDASVPQTLVVGCSSEGAADEVQAVLESGMKVLAGALQAPFVTPGGGCCEMLLAARIRQQLQHQRDAYARQGVHRAAVEAFATCLEAVAAGLVPLGCKRDVVDAWQEALMQSGVDDNTAAGVRQASSPRSYVGWSHRAQQIQSIASWRMGSPALDEAQVLDLAAAKLGALSAAVEAACALMRLDGMLQGTEQQTPTP